MRIASNHSNLEAVARCGCCLNSQHLCHIHRNPTVMFGKVDNRKIYKQLDNYNVYRCSFQKFRSLVLCSDNLVLEHASPESLQWSIETSRRCIVLGPIAKPFQKAFKPIGSFNRYTVWQSRWVHKDRMSFWQPATDSLQSFMQYVGDNNYSWINCSVGQFFAYAKNVVHTPHLSTFKYLTLPKYRETVSGIKPKPKTLFD